MHKKDSLHTFAGLLIAQGPLCYNGVSFEIADSWEHSSYDNSHGKQKGSTFFDYADLRGLNNSEILKGWRLPSEAEWNKIITADPAIREGSVVNGVPHVHWASIRLGAENGSPWGLLIFPDGETITGKALTAVDAKKPVPKEMSGEDLDVYLKQGCVFLPASGFFDRNGWTKRGGCYWSGSEYDDSFAYGFGFGPGGIGTDHDLLKTDYYPAWLVRETI